ncbi:MAG: hypothetical protein WC793_00515 [Candidatus Paceibacterota bacterium]|jgi:hypothetical protein
MATQNEFKKLASERLTTAEFLIEAGEWLMAAYIMGFVLECVLKAASCKTLHLSKYPEFGNGVKQEVAAYFRTHNFDQLLVVSGLSDIFTLTGKYSSQWSGFTQEYQGKWTDLRYDIYAKQFTEEKVKNMHTFLKNGIIKAIEEEKRW